MSTYGDSTTTEGPLRKYILAQFRSDADFGWVGRVRAALVKDELKYRDFHPARPRLRQDKNLWTSIEKGLAQATIVIIDPGQYTELVTDLLDSAAIEKAGSREKAIIEGCTTEIVAGTPVACLSNHVYREIDWDQQPVTSFAAFAPSEIQKRLGGGLNKAMVFAARAHATFDVPRLGGSVSTQSILLSPRLFRLVLPEVLGTARIFDNENPVSAQLLNEAIAAIAKSQEDYLPTIGMLSKEPLIKEVDSRTFDQLQACDIAAGWARDMLETGDVNVLGSRFERVWKNGQRIK